MNELLREREAEHAAEGVIEEMGFGEAPICPVTIANRKGIAVEPKPAEVEGVSGFVGGSPTQECDRLWSTAGTTAPHGESLLEVPIASITIAPGRRPIRDLDPLVDSIREVGLLNPVTVTEDHRLVAGYHRLEACRVLGWEAIPANVVDLDRLHADLAEIDENLIRNELTVLDRSAQFARRKEIYEAIHPDTRHGGDRRSEEARSSGNDFRSKSFAEDTAAKAGVSPRTVRHEVQIHESIAEEAKEVLRETPLADSKTDLLQLARVPKEDQREVVAIALAEDLTIPQAKRESSRRKKKETLKARADSVPPDPDPTWALVVGDCLAVMETIAPGSTRLVFADPPYNIGIDYGDGKQADLLPADEFLDWSESWILAAANLLADDGSMWVLINDEWAAYVDIFLRNAGLTRRRWIKWYETFGVNNAKNFNRTSRHLFYCVKDPKRFTFHPEAVNRPSDRQAKYGDKRADPGGKVWDDVWGINPPIPRLVENSAERLPGFPTQLPLALLEAVVGCSSDPGDLVLDPFSGSGTTGEAALRLGRRYLGIEQNPAFAEAARLRLAVASMSPSLSRLA